MGGDLNHKHSSLILSLVIGGLGCLIAWLVTADSSPLADYFLYHTTIPNIWATLHVVPYLITTLLQSTWLSDELVSYVAVGLQWALVAYLIIRWTRWRRRSD